jgi:hypothetical protein
MNTDPRHTDLYVSARTFLAHGYVDLCLAAWPSAKGPELDLATRWALLTWLMDDVFDVELRDATTDEIRTMGRALIVATNRPRWSGAAEPEPTHPAARALADLSRETQAAMPDGWWQRYRMQLIAWVDAAQTKGQLLRRGAPTLREYLTIRPADGGMLLAAMWTELALECVTLDWADPLVQAMLECFSACGIAVNDLAGDADAFTPTAALAAHGTTQDEARRRATEWLQGEEHRWWMLCTAVRTGGYGQATVRLAAGLDHFRRALTEWTAASSRYALAAPESAL